MCIIVAKKSGVELPSKFVLETCFLANPHGVGFMYNNKGRVIIEKGFMDFYEFYERLIEIDNRIDLSSKGLVIHFRIATSGLIDQGNCHPYPITKANKFLRSTFISCPIAMAHNGIILKYHKKNSQLNDTQLFIKNDVYTIIKKYSLMFYKDERILSYLLKISNSKLAFLDQNGQMTLIGKFVNDEGIYYSNNSYLYGLNKYRIHHK